MQTLTAMEDHNDEFVILTFNEVCQLLRFKPSKLYYYTAAKKIPYYKVDGLLSFEKSEVLEWFRHYRRGPEA